MKGIGALIFIILAYAAYYFTPTDVPAGFRVASSDNKPADDLTHDVAPLGETSFSDRTLQVGLNFSHQQGDERLAGIDESLGSGACSADFNNDGWVDLFLVNGSGQTRYYGKPYWWQQVKGNALYLNNGDGGFDDVTVDAGLAKPIWGMGCLVADFDNDGNADLFITAKDGNWLYRNGGDGHFVDMTAQSGVQDRGWTTSTAVADFNRDGLLDLYVGRFIDFDKGKKTYETNSQFVAEKSTTFDASLFSALPNRLYLNQGDFKFKEIAQSLGVEDNDGRTLDVSWQDLDKDGWLDLLISNDKGTGSNKAYLNRQGGGFEPIAQPLGLRSALGSRGIGSGDLDNDGNLDLVIASPAGENVLALFWLSNDKGAGRFKDLARDIGIAGDHYMSVSGWSPLIRDFNNDGFNDLMIASGFLEPDPDTMRVSLGQAKKIWFNDGRGHFIDGERFAGLALKDKQSARGVTAADFDNDGDVDLYITHNNDLGQYLRNELASGNWLGLKLVGRNANRDAIGAIVHLEAEHSRQTKSISSGEGFLSDSDKRLLFGLAGNPGPVNIVVEWPGGKRQKFRISQLNRYWQLVEAESDPQNYPLKARPNDASSMRLSLGADQPSIRIRHLEFLKRYAGEAELIVGLQQAMQDQAGEVRHAAIKLASELGKGQGLPILLQALDDPLAENVITAISALRGFEDEASVRWLLRGFGRDNPEIKIALADTFAYFFGEEEAVIYRKYLAVPYLIRLLDDSEPQVRKAAARALAVAERFRGLNALIDHLQDRDFEVRAEIVRALGLIRQAEALPSLNALLDDSEQPANVVANLLLALKRLDAADAAGLMVRFFQGGDKFADRPWSERLACLESLVAINQREAVFNQQQLQRLVGDLFRQFKPETSEEQFLWIGIWRCFDDPSGREWMSKQLTSNDSNLRGLAYRSLLANLPGHAFKLLGQAARDADPEIATWAFSEAFARRVSLGSADYQRLIDNQPLREQVLKRLSANPAALAEPMPDGLFAVLAKPGLSRQEAIVSVCVSRLTSLNVFCPSLLFASATDDKTLNLARQLLRDVNGDLSLRRALLSRYSQQFDQDAINQLFSFAQNRKDKLRPLLLEKLFAFDDGALNGFARKIAEDQGETAEARFAAIEFLSRHGDAAARALLYR